MKSNAWFRWVRYPHGRKLELRHGRHATCSTSSPGIVKCKEFVKKARLEQEHGKRQSDLEGLTYATALEHIYKAYYTLQTS